MAVFASGAHECVLIAPGSEWLGQVIISACFQTGHDVVRVVSGSHHDDGDVTVRRMVRHNSNPSIPGSMMSISTTSDG